MCILNANANIFIFVLSSVIWGGSNNYKSPIIITKKGNRVENHFDSIAFFQYKKALYFLPIALIQAAIFLTSPFGK